MSGIIFILVFISIFGPKVGLIDIAVLGYCFIGFILLSNIKSIKYPKEYVVLCMLTVILLLYSIIVALFTDSNDLYFVLRNFRAFIAIGILGLIFYNIRMPIVELVNITIIVLLIHSLSILIEMQFPVLKIYLSPIVSYDKEMLPLRAFGLIGGYDGAGFLCVIGAILSLVMFHYTGFFKYVAFSLIFFISVFFVSRMNMVIMLIVIISSIRVWLTRRKVNLITKFIIISFLIVGSYLFINLIYPILYYTIPFINQYFISTGITTTNYSISYGLGGQNYLLNTMWKIPESIAGFIFGTGLLPEGSDIGYVKVLFMTGIIGILISIFYYGYIIRALKRKLIIIDKYRLNTYDSYIKNISKSFIVIISLLFLYNFKNLFFFSRTFHELIIILFFTFLADVNRSKVFDSNNNTKLYTT